jgi:xanthine dehydrogenase accessory factor
MQRPLVVVRGGGELATAAARLLFLDGFPVAVLELPAPLAVRRLVSFAEAVRSGSLSVEGVEGRRIPRRDLPAAIAVGGFVPVAVDPEAAALGELEPAVVVDGRMLKQARRPGRVGRPPTIALGPGWRAGSEVEAVVETQRGPRLGRVLLDGAAEEDTGRPAPVLGVRDDRVLRAPCAGRFRAARRIGDSVAPGERVGTVGGEPALAGVAGVLRGLIGDGVEVASGTKLGDVDPRGAAVDPAAVSDKARAVACGVLEAVLLLLGRGPGAGL